MRKSKARTDFSTEFFDSFDEREDGFEFERAVLAGDYGDDHPACVLRVLEGDDPDEEYWDYLTERYWILKRQDIDTFEEDEDAD